jgi:hypothetical protein
MRWNAVERWNSVDIASEILFHLSNRVVEQAGFSAAGEGIDRDPLPSNPTH